MAEMVQPQVPAPGHAILAIALNTFKEAVRDRIFYLLLAFALILIGTSRALSLLTVGEEGKIVKDVGLSAISIFGVMVAGFVGVSLVFKEIEKRTVFTLLANPVRRWQFLCGKYVGLAGVLATNVVAMTLALGLVLLLRGEFTFALLPAIALTYVELLVITAFALFFSSLTNPILAAIWTFAAYVAGHLSWSLRLLQDRLPDGPAQWLFEAIYWLLPNLSRLNVRREVVHDIPIDAAAIGLGLGYGLGYALLILMAACWVFERRDFN